MLIVTRGSRVGWGLVGRNGCQDAASMAAHVPTAGSGSVRSAKATEFCHALNQGGCATRQQRPEDLVYKPSSILR